MKLAIAVSLISLPLAVLSVSAPVNEKWGIGSYGGKVGVIAYEDRYIPEEKAIVKSTKELEEEAGNGTTLEDEASIKPVKVGEEEAAEDEEEPVYVTSTQTVYTTVTVQRTHTPEATPTPAPARRSVVGDIHEHAKRHGHNHAKKRFVGMNKH